MGITDRMAPPSEPAVANGKAPRLSVIVVAYNMARELPRTLFTLSSSYQRRIPGDEYEVIVVDNGSLEPIRESVIQAFGANFRLLRLEANPSPAAAVNISAREAQGEALSLCIDGARMVTPGILRLSLQALRLHKNPLVSTASLHLGPKLQNDSMLEGYNQKTEDILLESVDWRKDGYELFRIASPAMSMKRGWFSPFTESNFITLRRSSFFDLGGLDERFTSPGGGLVNLDFYRTACERLGQVVILLGEGNFHQYHGGVATNAPRDQHPAEHFHREYEAIRGRPFAMAECPHLYLGTVPPQATPLLSQAMRRLEKTQQAPPLPA
jgi:glycosyltransferase involved in cell wall biosynthesis